MADLILAPLHGALGWLVAGLALLVTEIVLPGVFLMWLGIAALGAGLVTQLFDPELWVQVVAFAVFAAIAITVALRLRRPPGPREVNAAGSGLLNRSARVLPGAELRVRVGDSDWPARLAHGTTQPDPGTTLRVVGVDGMTVIVGGSSDG